MTDAQIEETLYVFVCLRCGVDSSHIFEDLAERDNWHDNHLRHTGHDRGRQRWTERWSDGKRVG